MGKSQSKLEVGPVVQVGIVVRDAAAMAHRWADLFGFGEVQIVDWPPSDSNLAETATYRGQPGAFRMRLAFVETGSVQLEFIEPLDGDNIYAEFLAEKGEGLHHLLFNAPDPKGVAEALQVDILQSGGSTLFPGAIWAYLDTQEKLGAMVEVRSKLED